MDLNRLNCCGIMEINGLSDFRSPASALKAFGGQVYHGYTYHTGYNTREVRWYEPEAGSKFAHVLFSAANKGKYGDNFKAYILDNKLGDVLETAIAHNPNSGNPVRAFLWTIDHKATEAFTANLCAKTIAAKKKLLANGELTEDDLDDHSDRYDYDGGDD